MTLKLSVNDFRDCVHDVLRERNNGSITEPVNVSGSTKLDALPIDSLDVATVMLALEARARCSIDWVGIEQAATVDELLSCAFVSSDASVGGVQHE